MWRLFLVTIGAALALAQSGPSFEVVSIKRNVSLERAMGGGPAPGQYRLRNYSLKVLIEQFNRLKTYQVAGLPAWTETERYDIVAKAKDNTSRAQMEEMMKTLLADRFHLKYHMETRDLPVYALVVGKNGIKFKEANPEDKGGMSNGPTFLHGTKMAMYMFTGFLSATVQRTIIDKTGLTGEYDFKLDWVADEAGAVPEADGALPANPRGPSLFTAIQEQMGLRLEATKGPVEVMVIDHVERPTEN